MFTGLVIKKAKITSLNSSNISIQIEPNFANIGDSIAINGVCLTVTQIKNNNYSFNISHETINLTIFKYLKTGDFVNIEPALKLSDGLHGHLVTGHIDTIATVSNINKQNNILDIIINYNDVKFCKWICTKGSITVNGVSLTVNELIEPTSFRLTLIPHTLELTNISDLQVGNLVNLEFDILAKYLERLVVCRSLEPKTVISEEYLKNLGY